MRQAKDGDNWPVTWGADDAIYSTWGDGTGFIPKVERKDWKFFERLGTDGNPVWTSDISRRGPVLENRESCLRSAITSSSPATTPSP